MEADRRVLVIGGGIAGLTTAYALQKAGLEVEVLEREATAGGRMRSERHGDFVVDRGAQFIASSYKNMRTLVEELGLRPHVRRLRTGRGATLRDGRFVQTNYAGLRAMLAAKDLSWGSRLRLPRMLVELRRHGPILDFYHIERAAPLDDGPASEWARRRFGREVLDDIIEPAFASTFTALPENLSRAFVLATVHYMFTSGFGLYAFEGGNGLLTQSLASRLKVRTGATVDQISHTVSGVSVRLEGGETLEANIAVVATPGNHVASLCPNLSDEEQRFFEGVRYARSIIVFFMTSSKRADPGLYGIGIGRPQGVRLYGMAFENPKEGAVPTGKTLFNCALSEELAAAVFEQSDEAVAAAAREELSKLPLEGLDEIEGFAVHRWPELVPQFYAGYIRSLAAFKERRERSDRIFFAGDYLVGPYTEAALTSGLRAAEEVLARLGGQDLLLNVNA
jgi:oxygen-dependent protoporphyrinogen oxidase